MSKSIIQTDWDRCFICGGIATEVHHVFPASNRPLSDADGLTVHLCHACHNEPPNGVHFDAELANRLKAVAERCWCDRYGKTIDDFIKRYGKNYI